MKTSTIVLGLAAVAAAVYVTKKEATAQPKPGTMPGTTPPNPMPPAPPVGPSLQTVDPKIGGWQIASLDAALASNPGIASYFPPGIPIHAYVASPTMATIVAATSSTTPGLDAGRVNTWIPMQRQAGHRVFMSPPIVSGGDTGRVFVLDVAPPGYVEVSA